MLIFKVMIELSSSLKQNLVHSNISIDYAKYYYVLVEKKQNQKKKENY